MAWRARLGPDNIYLGSEEIDSLGVDDVAVPENCDLKSGAYRWNRESNRFDPIHLLPRDVTEMPNVLRAVAIGFRAIRDGTELPQETLSFIDWYERRFEGKKGPP